MEDDQQFCLRWNNHQSTLIQNFDTLLESGTLVDCTLAAEGKTLKAHKVVLSACSPYFECLLSEHYDKHPVFILKDVKFKELKAMMDYMYRGEVNISQDQLAALLKAAESLQIKGLSESKTAGSSKTEFRPQKTVSQPTAPSLDIPHASSGLTIEKNKVPRQSLAQSSVADVPEDTASPQVSKGLSSREGSQSPTSRKRKRCRRRSLNEDNTIENQDASNSSDMPQQMGVPALGIAPVADEKVHSDPTDSLGRSALMTQLTKPADEMLQLPLEKPEPNDNLIEPKSEYLEDTEENVEDLTLDEDMNDLNDMEQDNNRAGPSHDPAQHPAGLGSWHVTGDRSNAGGVVGSVAGAAGTTDEVFLAAQEAAQAHRDSQEKESSQEIEAILPQKEKKGKENLKEEKSLNQKEKTSEKKKKLKRNKDELFVNDSPSTSTAMRNFRNTDQKSSKGPDVISLIDSQTTEASDSESESSSPWTDSKDVAKLKKHKCPHCDMTFEQRHHLIHHIMTTCLVNPDSKTNKKSGLYKCHKCGRSYSYLKNLTYHKKHECNQTTQCPRCGKVFKGSIVPERHKEYYCVNKRRRQENKSKLNIKQESPDELFVDESSIDSSD